MISPSFFCGQLKEMGVGFYSGVPDSLLKNLCAYITDTVPIVLVPTTYNQFKESEFKEWGANVIIYANHMLRASYPAMVKVAKTILENERSLEADDLCMPIKEILELIPNSK